MNKTLLLCSLMGVLALSACGRQPAPEDAAGNATAAEESASGDKGLLGFGDGKDEATSSPGLPQADMKRPLDSYPELRSGQQIMFLYVAASRLPPDFPKLAGRYSEEYRHASDTFRKNDLLNAIKPQLEQKIEEAEKTPYAWMQVNHANLGPYDFERKGFPVHEFDPGSERYFYDDSSYRITWSNGDQVRFLSVPDETKAREIEALRNIAQALQMKIYFFAQGADLNQQMVNAYVTRVRIVDKTGRVIAEYGPGE